jgi:hypothetical protein
MKRKAMIPLRLTDLQDMLGLSKGTQIYNAFIGSDDMLYLKVTSSQAPICLEGAVIEVVPLDEARKWE